MNPEENEVEFLEEEETIDETNKVRRAASEMANWLIKKKLARNEKSANRILILIIVVAFSLTGYIIFRSF